ncbi:MAG: hypothetical protein J6Y29_06120 [Clostridiales bacterium]|nr:hypothetical protein [Clostridiales bacterium]
MIIDAMVDRFEDGNTYFVLDDIKAEISIPNEVKKDDFEVGDMVKLTISNNGKVTVLRQ